MTIAAILALALVALATGAYAYLVYSPKPQMPPLSSDVQHAKRSYLAYVPASLPSGAALVSSDGDGVPLALVFAQEHGAGFEAPRAIGS
jgi:hypothetical protein